MSYAAATADLTDPPRMTPAIRWIIALNVAVFFLQTMTVVSPADMQQALGVTLDDFPGRWWKAFTYMFVHQNLLHLAGNMYVLWLFGTRVEHMMGKAWGFTRYYFICGLAAVALHLLVFRDGLLFGASGAVYGVMVAYAMHWPDQEMFVFPLPKPVKVKWVAAAYVGYDLFRAAVWTDTGGTAHWAHVGGAAAGFLYFFLQRTPPAEGIDRLRQRITPAPEVPDETPRAIPRSLPRPREQRQEVDDVVAKSKAVAAQRRPIPVQAAKPRTDRSGELDLVLEKISRQGLDSLTSDERALLEEMSRRLRDR